MPTTQNRPIALVAEDEAIIRLDVADMLDAFGFEVLEVASGDEAMTLLKARHGAVSLLFSDVDMPGSRNGFALAREVATRWPEISVVIVSGRFSPEPGDLPEGAVFLGKPFSTEMVDHVRQGGVIGLGVPPRPAGLRPL